MASLNNMVKRLAGLLGTGNLNAWEAQFVTNVLERSKQGENTSTITEEQIEVIELIFDNNFAG